MKRPKGFTLLELLIVMTIVAILATVAVPNFFRLIQDSRMSTGANDLIASLNFARSEAVRRGENVRVCSTNVTATVCADSADWQDGWIVWFDQDLDESVPTNTASDQYNIEVLRVTARLGGSLTVTKNDTNRIQYNSTGIENETTTVDTFDVCNSNENNERSRIVTIGVTGRVNVNQIEVGEAGYPCNAP